MNFLDQLNLRPMERRIVVAAMITVFVVLNVWFVWPHFKDWAKLQDDFKQALRTLSNYQEEIKRKPELETTRATLEGAGEGLLVEEMAVQLRRLIQNQASQSGIVPNVTDLPRPVPKPGQMFEEQAVKVTFTAEEQELVDFLYNLSAGRSMIRVKDMNIRPDPQQQKLQGEVTLVASYQRKTVSKATASPASSPAKPAPAPGNKPAPVTNKPAPAPKPAVAPSKNPSAKPKPGSANVVR